jgi:hypothetical protein
MQIPRPPNAITKARRDANPETANANRSKYSSACFQLKVTHPNPLKKMGGDV